MNIDKQYSLLGQCSTEIRVLRDTIANLAPRARAFDALEKVLNLTHREGGAMGEDILWRIDREMGILHEAIQQKDKDIER